MLFSIRYTGPIELLDNVCFEKILLCREVASSEHYHGIIDFDDEGKCNKIRYQLRKHGIIGNKMFSLSIVKDEDKAFAYCVKEQDIYKNSLLSQEKLDYYKSISYVKSKKVSNKMNIIDKFMENIDYYKNLSKKDAISNVSEYVVNYYEENNRLMNEFQMVGYTKLLLCKLGYDYKRNIKVSIISQLGSFM